METLGSDYFVVKPAILHLTREAALRIGFSEDELAAAWSPVVDEETGAESEREDGELRVEAGALIPGDIAEGWGENGRVVHHLVHNRILAPVPAKESKVELGEVLDTLQIEKDRDAAEERAEAAEAENAALAARVAELEEWQATAAAEAAAAEAAASAAAGTEDGDQPESEPAIESGSEGGEDGAEGGSAEPAGDGAPDSDDKPFPRHKGGGIFTLSDGSEMRGKKDAIAAQLELDAKSSEA